MKHPEVLFVCLVLSSALVAPGCGSDSSTSVFSEELSQRLALARRPMIVEAAPPSIQKLGATPPPPPAKVVAKHEPPPAVPETPKWRMILLRGSHAQTLTFDQPAQVELSKRDDVDSKETPNP